MATSKVVEGGAASLGVGVDVVVVEKGAGVAAGVGAFGVGLIDDTSLAAGG